VKTRIWQVRVYYRPSTAYTGTGGTLLCTFSLTRWQHFFCVKWRHGRHIDSVTSNRKYDSVSRCIFTWRTFLSNFIPIQFETTEHWAFFEAVVPTRTEEKDEIIFWSKSYKNGIRLSIYSSSRFHLISSQR